MCLYRDPSSSSSSPMMGRGILLALNDTFFFLLGGSAWILINGIYAQVPFIILMFNGDYGVVSKITLCVTLSSLLPILLSISFFESFPRAPVVSSSKHLSDANANRSERTIRDATQTYTSDNQSWYIDLGISLVLSIGIVTSFVLTFWTEDVTSQLSPLMATVTAGGIVGTTSSILYYPHAATTANAVSLDFEPSATTSNVAKRQTTAMLLGTATSNLFVAVLAILQKEKLEQRSDDLPTTVIIRNYFSVLMILMVFSAAGFVGTLLTRHAMNENAASDLSKCKADHHIRFNEQASLLETHSTEDWTIKVSDQYKQQSRPLKKSNHKSLSFWEISYLNSALNAAQFVLNALTFFLPGIVPYSVSNGYDEKNGTFDALQYLIVFQLIAQTLGVLASSRGGSGSGQTTKLIVHCQLGSFFLFLWIPMVFLSLSNQKKFGNTIPIFLNTLLNFAYAYCNTSWFHFSVHHHHHKEHYHPNGDTEEGAVASTKKANEPIYLKNGETVSTTSAIRIMGTWHQVGATFGSAIAFAMVQSGAIVSN